MAGQIVTVSASACARLVEAAAQSCTIKAAATVSASPAQVPSAEPNWDAMATSLSVLGAAIGVGGAVLAVIALVAGIAWAKLVRGAAREIAREESRKCAEEHMKKWLDEVAPQIISKHMQNLGDSTIGDGDDQKAAEALAKEV